MYRVKVYKSIFNKSYFWYTVRCLREMQKEGVLELEIIDSSFFQDHDHAYELIFIDGCPVFIDLRDDFTIDKQELPNIKEDFKILKANYSSELWDMAEKGIYPEGVPYRLKDWELPLRKHIRPFALGRTFSTNVKEELKNYNYIGPIKYKVVSATGVGILKIQSESRIKVYEMFNEIFGGKAKLIYFDKHHGIMKETPDNLSYYLKKYPIDYPIHGIEDYFGFLSLGEYSINIAGIALSTPFRLVDSVLVGRCCISTKIWHDVYKTFPCIELPICGYTGLGDWDKTKVILKDLDKVDYNFLLQRARNWYDQFLSTKGMWENQILRALK